MQTCPFNQPKSRRHLTAPRGALVLLAVALVGLALSGCERYPIPTITPYRPATAPVQATPQAVVVADVTTVAATAAPTPTAVLPSATATAAAQPSATPRRVEPIPSMERRPPPSTATAAPTVTPSPTPLPPTATPIPTPSFLQERIANLFDLSRLPVLKQSFATQFTSRNWTTLEHYFDYFLDDGAFIGPDYGYLKEDGTRLSYKIVTAYDGKPEYEIIPRTPGPGSIDRIWFAYQQHESVNNTKDMSRDEEWANWGNLASMGTIRFYFDDEPTPRLEFGIKDLFVGRNPFPAPLAAFYASADGGNINYVPIPFRRSIRIATTGRPRLMQVQITRWDSSTGSALMASAVTSGAGAPAVPVATSAGPIESFRPVLTVQEQSTLDQAVQAWRTCTAASSGDLRTVALDIPHNNSAAVEFRIPATLAQLRVRVPLGQEDSVWMQVYWDGEKNPSMTAPLRGMFGTAEQLLPYRALPMGIIKTETETVFYSNMPMPFESARIVFTNNRAEALSLKLDLQTRETLPGAERVRLHAFYGSRRVERRQDDKDNYVLIDVKGSGKYLGAILSAWDMDRGALNGPLDEHWRFPYLESNYDVWTDDRLALPGTGIEDDFNASYYYVFYGYPNYKTTYCLAGVTLLDYSTQSEPSSQYRFYLNDAPEFRDHLRVEVEHGNKGNNLTMTYSSTAFWYQVR